MRRVTISLAALALTAAGCAETDEAGLTADCVKNAFGAEFCGEEARQYCAEFGGPACAELGYDSEGRLGRELDQQERELEREQRELEQELDELQYDY